MSRTSVLVSEPTHRLLVDLATTTGSSLEEVLARALDAYRRQLFFEGLKADYASLEADPEAWADELDERRAWEATLADGLDPEERWTEDGRCLGTDSPSEGS